ncbi:hypothetical protein fugu_015801 [Takifugu bimaculatus]|uniref:Uncharacterized protein n=1 Tax=Takifugu bimaculatus TaxID=433685 RepID=A0A4Z2BXM2_9TELE|nr:hypothetical protein fugu_015801 [Takifugu bimaculatus]
MTVHVQTTQVPHGGAVPSTQTAEIKLTICSLTPFFRILMILSGYIYGGTKVRPHHTPTSGLSFEIPAITPIRSYRDSPAMNLPYVPDQRAQQAQYRVPCVSMSTDLNRC